MTIIQISRKTLLSGAVSLLTVLLLSLGGCLPSKKPSPRIDYYTLDYAPVPLDLAADGPLPVMIKVERFSISPSYDTDKITYRENGTTSNYTYHRWRANPADLVRYYLTRDLQAGNVVAAVLPATSRSASTHVLEGIVDEFLEVDGEKTWHAVLSITFTLTRSGEPDISKRVVLQKSFSRKVECSDKHPLSVSRAMAKALAEISEQLNREIYDALK